MRISWAKCQRRLATLWFAGSGVVFLVVLLQTVVQSYGGLVKEAWGWLLPTIVPTLSMIIGVLAIDASGEGGEARTVDRFFFRLTFFLSLAYLMTVLSTIVLNYYFSPPGPEAVHAVALMKLSNLWLGPFQGVVSAALVVFFVRGAKDESGGSHNGK